MSDEEEESYYQTYTLQQFMNRIKLTNDAENYYTSNFAMKDEVKVESKLLFNAIYNESKDRGHIDVVFENETYGFEYIKNDSKMYVSCLRTTGSEYETSKMLEEIDQKHLNMLDSVYDRKEYQWMNHWSQILSPYATSVKVVEQKKEKYDPNEVVSQPPPPPNPNYNTTQYEIEEDTKDEEEAVVEEEQQENEEEEEQQTYDNNEEEEPQEEYYDEEYQEEEYNQ